MRRIFQRARCSRRAGAVLAALLAVLVLAAACSAEDDAPNQAACEQVCAKQCSCGTNVCGSGPGGANDGCVKSCTGTGDFDKTPSCQAYIDCTLAKSCEELKAGVCIGICSK